MLVNFEMNLLVFTLWFLISNFLALVRPITERILSSVAQPRSSALFFTVLFISAPAVRGCQRSMGHAQEGRLAGWLWLGTGCLVPKPRTGPPSVPPPTAAWQKSSGEACWLQQLLGTTEGLYSQLSSLHLQQCQSGLKVNISIVFALLTRPTATKQTQRLHFIMMCNGEK